MRRLFLFLLLIMAWPHSSRAQGVVIGTSCPAAGQNAISTQGVPVVCTGSPLVWTNPNGSSSGSGNGVGSGAAPIMAYYLSNSCPIANTGSCYFTYADTLMDNTCSWTSSTAQAVCSDGPFKSTDCVGGTGCTGTGTSKSLAGWSSCQADQVGLLSTFTNGAISNTANVTISSFTSSTTVGLSATPANAVASAGCVFFGHLDDTGAAAFDAAIAASTQCPKGMLAAAYYQYQNPHHYAQPNSCSITEPLVNFAGPGYGNTTLPAGLELEGRGTGPTVVFLNPSFPNGDACTRKATSSQTTGGCFAIPLLGKWVDLRLSGGGNFIASNMSGKNLITMAVGTLMNFTCTNFGAGQSSMAGINMGQFSQLYQVNNSGCGGLGIVSETGSLNNVLFRTVVENSGTNALLINSGSQVFCYWCDFAGPITSTGLDIISNNGGSLSGFGMQAKIANATSTTTSGTIVYHATATGAKLYADNSSFIANYGSNTNNGAVWCAFTPCVVSLVNGSQLLGGSTSFSYADTAGGTLYIDPSTLFNLPFSNGNISGTIAADGHSFGAGCTGTATASSTLGLYNPFANPTTTASACSSTTIGTGFPMQRAATIYGLQCKSTATTVSVACKIVVNGTPNATETCTMTATTTCNDFTHSILVNKNDLITPEIVTGAAETGANITLSFFWQ